MNYTIQYWPFSEPQSKSFWAAGLDNSTTIRVTSDQLYYFQVLKIHLIIILSPSKRNGFLGVERSSLDKGREARCNEKKNPGEVRARTIPHQIAQPIRSTVLPIGQTTRCCLVQARNSSGFFTTLGMSGMFLAGTSTGGAVANRLRRRTSDQRSSVQIRPWPLR